MHRLPGASTGLNLGAVCLLIAATSLLTACGRHKETRETSGETLPTAQVRVQAVESKQETTSVEVAGTIRARLSATLEASVSGRIEAMPVLLGQRVKQGQLIARLNAAEIKARLDQAQASLEQAERDWNRTSELFKNQAVTRSEYERAEARQRVAKASVAEAGAMMAYVEVVAPFDAVVTRKLTDVGDLATPGKPLIEIEDPSLLQLDADVPESLAARIEQGAELKIRAESLKTDAHGKVAEIAPAADRASRTFRVKVDLPADSGLRSGQFARLLIPTGERSTLCVPASAVIERGQLEIVFVAINGRAQLQLVKTGKRDGDRIEILSGLEPGDSVVIEGAGLLRDGQPVEVK